MNLPEIYHSVILWIGDCTGLPDALLHVHAGMAILVLVRVVTNRSLGSFIPLVAVVIAELSNEAMDWLNHGVLWNDTIFDVGNTLFWPIVISIAVRIRPFVSKS